MITNYDRHELGNGSRISTKIQINLIQKPNQKFIEMKSQKLYVLHWKIKKN